MMFYFPAAATTNITTTVLPLPPLPPPIPPTSLPFYYIGSKLHMLLWVVFYFSQKGQ
jgi:hypothetical protein